MSVDSFSLDSFSLGGVAPARAADAPGLVSAVAPHLRAEEDVIRCAAAAALGADASPEAAPFLVEALLDEDPDVRSDAMASLVLCARPEDAEAVRRSLIGDPVKEVKVAAIETLARLEDPASTELIRALAQDRRETEVAWEDESGLWDDWLDVQIAAIDALGRMGDSGAIDDLLAARDDEMGQELDTVVFRALASIPEGGIATLLGLMRSQDPKTRERASAALAEARRALVAPLADLLLRDANPALRHLGLSVLDETAPSLPALAAEDPDASVRRAALSRMAAPSAALLTRAMADPDERVAATALERWRDGGLPAEEDLLVNAEAWLAEAGAPLAAASARLLAAARGADALEALGAAARRSERPLDLRVEAAKQLGALPADAARETLRGLLIDPARQVRVAALAALAGYRDDAAATQILVDAIHGGIDAPALAAREPLSDDGAGSPAAAKVEDAPAGRIRISPDGEIIEDDAAEAAPMLSTLAAIQSQSRSETSRGEDGGDEDRGHEDGGDGDGGGSDEGRKRRVAVEGPDDVSADLRRAALRVAADHPAPAVAAALCETADQADPSLALAAIEALSRRAGEVALTAPELDRLADALQAKDAVRRGFAAQGLGRALANGAPTDYAARLATRLDDEDAIVRASALAAAAPAARDRVVQALGDPVKSVRDAALGALGRAGDQAGLGDGLAVALAGGFHETAAAICRQWPAGLEQLVGICAGPETSAGLLRHALSALAARRTV